MPDPLLHTYILNIYCDVVCYREKGGEVNSLTFLYLNQQALRLTVKMVYERRSATRTL